MPRTRVLVLGGTSGIGAACAEHLESEYLVSGEAITVGVDDFDIRHVYPMNKCLQELRPTHIVYSVGVHAMNWVRDIQAPELRHLMDVNVWGFVNTISCAVRLGYPLSVVAITSDAARRPMRTSLAYCASKAALEMAVRCASRELAPDGWRINGVAPGKVADTPMTEYVDATVPALRGWTAEQAAAYEKASSAIGRPVTAAEVAMVVAQVLMSDAEAWTGDIISVNGGR